MLKFFRNLPAGKAGVRQKLLQQNRITQYLAYSIGEILQVMVENDSPFRDLIWVERKIIKGPSVPLGTGYNL